MEKTIMPGNANFPLLSELLKNLLHMNVLILDDNKQEQLDDFEKKYCYNSVLQPMFTGDYLRSFHETLEERCICCLEDPLGTRIYLFRLEGKTVLLGPSVRLRGQTPLQVFIISAAKMPPDGLPTQKSPAARSRCGSQDFSHNSKPHLQGLTELQGPYKVLNRSSSST